MSSQVSGIVSAASCFSISGGVGIIALHAAQCYRPALVLLLILFSGLAFRSLSAEVLSIENSHILAMFVLFYVSHMSCALLVEQYTLPKRADTKAEWDFWAAYKMLFNARWVGTGKTVISETFPSSSPSSETSDVENEFERKVEKPNKDARMVEKIRFWLNNPRIAFIRNRITQFALIYAASKAFDALPERVFTQFFEPLAFEDFLPDQTVYFRRISEVTLRETVIRAWVVVYFCWSTYSSLTKIHCVLSIAFVGLKIDEPLDWPNLYGSLSEAYSVRRFWGKFWHKLVYRSYTSFGKHVSLKVLHLPRNSIVGRMFINFFVFYLSGCVHGLVQFQLGYSCGWKEDVCWYSGCFFMILLETLATFTTRKLLGRKAWNFIMQDHICKPIGFLWVFGCLFWSLPKGEYSKMLCFPV